MRHRQPCANSQAVIQQVGLQTNEWPWCNSQSCADFAPYTKKLPNKKQAALAPSQGERHGRQARLGRSWCPGRMQKWSTQAVPHAIWQGKHRLRRMLQSDETRLTQSVVENAKDEDEEQKEGDGGGWGGGEKRETLNCRHDFSHMARRLGIPMSVVADTTLTAQGKQWQDEISPIASRGQKRPGTLRVSQFHSCVATKDRGTSALSGA